MLKNSFKGAMALALAVSLYSCEEESTSQNQVPEQSLVEFKGLPVNHESRAIEALDYTIEDYQALYLNKNVPDLSNGQNTGHSGKS